MTTGRTAGARSESPARVFPQTVWIEYKECDDGLCIAGKRVRKADYAYRIPAPYPNPKLTLDKLLQLAKGPRVFFWNVLHPICLLLYRLRTI